MRSCGDCTKCCEGHLAAKVKDFDMSPGNPCPVLQIGKGCTDYENRPKDPCQVFSCQWLKNPIIPEWLKPSESGVIITVQRIKDIEFLKLTAAPDFPDADALTWFITFVLKNKINGAWDAPRKKYWTGSPEFIQTMNEEFGS